MSLSDKRITAQANRDILLTPMYYENDVKEFIKELKEEFIKRAGYDGIRNPDKIVDKLAGDELI